MNLLNMLASTMTSDTSLNALSQKTGGSVEQITKLIQSALPILLKFLTKNASSTAGAQSLLGALSQHTNTRSMDLQIGDADEEDGGKIVRHILGDQSEKVVNALSKETQLNTDQVNRALSDIAPALMSGLSAATNSASKVNLADGLDLSDLMGMFGGAAPAASQSSGLLGGLGNLMGGVLGGGSGNAASQGGGGLLGGLLGGGSGNGASQGGGLLGGLFGGGKPEASAVSGLDGLLGGNTAGLGNLLGGLFDGDDDQNEASFDGSNLLGMLTSLMK